MIPSQETQIQLLQEKIEELERRLQKAEDELEESYRERTGVTI